MESPTSQRWATPPEGPGPDAQSNRGAMPVQDAVPATPPRRQPWARGLLVNAMVQDGVVALRGFVGGESERRALRIAAESVPGVRRLEDDLAIRPSYAAE